MGGRERLTVGPRKAPAGGAAGFAGRGAKP